MFWKKLSVILDRCGELPHVSWCFLGCGLIRAWLGLVLAAIQTSEAFTQISPLNGTTALRVGEAACFLTLSLIAFRSTHLHRSGFLLIGSLLLPMAGCLLAGFTLLHFNPALYIVGLFTCGLGYALSLLLWLEVYGCLKTELMIFAWTASFFVNFALWGLASISGPTLKAILFFGLPTFSFACLVASSRHLEPENYPPPPRDRRPATSPGFCCFGSQPSGSCMASATASPARRFRPCPLGSACSSRRSSPSPALHSA